jgi:glutathione S-transferase
MGQNVLWARAYGLCQSTAFEEYVSRLSQRPAFASAYSDLGEFSLAPPADSPETLRQKFSG